jgi:hypothetical protein
MCGYSDVRKFGDIYRCTGCGRRMDSQWLEWVKSSNISLPKPANRLQRAWHNLRDEALILMRPSPGAYAESDVSARFPRMQRRNFRGYETRES